AAWLGCPSGRQRIARIERHIHNTAALHSMRRAPRPLFLDVPQKEPVVAWIRIDDAANGAMFGGDLRLDPAPTAAVPGDDDGAFDVYPRFRELLVVLRCPVVHVDEIGGDVTVGRVGIEGRKLPSVARIRIV